MKQEFRLEGDEEAKRAFGNHDYNLRALEKAFKVKVAVRSDLLSITGADNKGLRKGIT